MLLILFQRIILYLGYAVNIVLINPEKAVKLAVNDELRHILKGNK